MKRIACALLLFTGCSIPSGYVTADRMTYGAIGTEYRGYVTADRMLSDKQKRRRLALVESWAARLDEAEAPDE